MKGHLCYTTRDNAQVTLQHAVVVVPVSTYTHKICIHKYCATLAASDVVCCRILTSDRFLPNDPLSSDVMDAWLMCIS